MTNRNIDQKNTLLAIKPAKKYTLRRAVNAMCKNCIYDPMPGLGNWRQQTEACEIMACPLWKFRPTSTSKKGKNNEEQ